MYNCGVQFFFYEDILGCTYFWLLSNLLKMVCRVVLYDIHVCFKKCSLFDVNTGVVNVDIASIFLQIYSIFIEGGCLANYYELYVQVWYHDFSIQSKSLFYGFKFTHIKCASVAFVLTSMSKNEGSYLLHHFRCLTLGKGLIWKCRLLSAKVSTWFVVIGVYCPRKWEISAWIKYCLKGVLCTSPHCYFAGIMVPKLLRILICILCLFLCRSCEEVVESIHNSLMKVKSYYISENL